MVSRGPDWLVQISDFGISRRLRPDQSTLGTMRRGTFGFIAPEMLGFIPDRSHPYAADIWSLGTVVFRMVTGKLFMTDFGLLQKYVASELQFPSEYLASYGITKSLASFLRSLLAPLPKERPTITEIASHDWFQHSPHPPEDCSSHNGSSEENSSDDSPDDSDDDSSEDDSSEDNLENDSSEDDSSEGGVQSQDEADPSNGTGDVASAAWSTAIISVKTAHQTHKTSAAMTSSPRNTTTPGSSISLGGNSSQALEIAARNQEYRSALSEYNYRTQSAYPLRPARFLVDEAGMVHRTEYDMTWFDVSGEMKWPPERPTQLRKRLHVDPEEIHKPTQRKTNSRRRRGTSNKSTDHVSSNQSKLRLGKQRNSSSPATTSASKKQRGSWASIWPWSSTSSSKTSSSKKSSSTSKRHTSIPKKSKATIRDIMDEPMVYAESFISRPTDITTAIRAHASYVEDVSAHEEFGGNDTKSDGEDGERDRFPLNSASGQRVIRFVAKQSDAEKFRIPPKYDLSRWDPRKTPLLFLYCVFDLVSIGIWFNDTIVSCQQYDQSIKSEDMDTIKELALLLEQLDNNLSTIAHHSSHIRKADDKELVQHFTDSGERLVIKVQKLLQAWQGMVSLEGGFAAKESWEGNLLESGAMKHLGTEKLRSKMEPLGQSLRLWLIRYNANCPDIFKQAKIRKPTGRV